MLTEDRGTLPNLLDLWGDNVTTSQRSNQNFGSQIWTRFKTRDLALRDCLISELESNQFRETEQTCKTEKNIRVVVGDSLLSTMVNSSHFITIIIIQSPMEINDIFTFCFFPTVFHNKFIDFRLGKSSCAPENVGDWMKSNVG